ncbi:MAG: phosphotransferase family protein [Candidatus Berkiella sp.]
MPFKNNWENTDQRISLSNEIIEKIISQTFRKEQLNLHEVIAGGCANLNIKFTLQNRSPLLLRIYLRDPDAAFREQALTQRLKHLLPTPQIYHIGKFEDYQFAICEFINGITLRDLLLSNQPYSLESLMHSAGEMLAKIQQITFSKAGFFDKNLDVISPIDQNSYLDFVKDTLKNPTINSELEPSTISKIDQIIQKFAHLFPDVSEKNLVHGDFDPANILVENINDEWQIAAILDWEFAFSGSTLCDIANMLRYRDDMPTTFESAFLEGLTTSGFTLASNWRTSIEILNLSSLLDCLARANPSTQPNQCQDIRNLIDKILARLQNTNI